MVKDLNDPTNVDTIPAMLTDGEFVINKEATAMYGPLLEKLNNKGLQMRVAENNAIKKNIGGPVQLSVAMRNTGGLVTFLKQKEGYSDTAYQDSGGVWTIGYGRTEGVQPGQVTSREVEDKWLEHRASQELDAVKGYAKQHGYDWNDGQLNALASFRYNGGPGMLDQLTAGGQRDNATIQQALPQYNKVTDPQSGQLVPVQGLSNRRAAELELWGGTTPKEAVPVPAPQPTPDVPMEPPMEAGFPLADLAQAAIPFNQQSMIPAPAIGLQGVNPEYIPSVTEGGLPSTMENPQMIHPQMQGYNRGGRATREEIERRRLLAAQQAAQSNQGQRRQVAGGPAEVAAPSAYTGGGRNQPHAAVPNLLQPLPPNAEPNINRFGQQAGALQGRINFAEPTMQGQVPQIQDTPPVPGSDEALLQSSSQQVEQREVAPEDWQSLVDPRDLAAAGLEGSGSGAIDSGIIGPDSVPSPEYVDAQIQGGFTSPEQVAAAEADIGPVPPGFEDAPIPRQAPGKSPIANPEEFKHKPTQRPDNAGGVMSTVTQTVADKGEPPTDQLMNTPKAQIVEAADRIEKKSPGTVKQAKNTIQQAFGDIFDGKELVRMGIIFAGALATGATPGQALAYAGQNYLARIDAQASTKAKYQQELLEGGKYTPQSIKTFIESEDPSVLVPTSPAVPIKELGNQKEFYGANGQRVLAREVEYGDNKVWLDKNNKPISLNHFHQDASRAEGTPEYRARIGDESKQLSKTFQEMQDRFGKFSTDKGDAYTTELTPGKVGLNAAKWAIKNDVPIDAMGQLLDNAYQQAINESKGGKKVRNITAYLNDQYVRSQVGDPTLFQNKDGESASAEKVNQLFNLYANQLSSLPQYQGLSSAAISSTVIQKARPIWTGLDPDIRVRYNRRAGPGETGFMVWLRDQVIKPQ